ncbi:MAG: 4Fe-4S binding protein [Oscillospiraceae bacterium]|nr:4Fe-4S binding protein [Oscillospiraceae bacterium]
MKKLVANSSKCTGCGACEIACSKAFYKEENREKSAIRVTANDGGYNISVCDQCGDCIWMCSAVALSQAPNGVVRLNKKSCVGCLICVGECLRNFFFYNNDLPTPFKCSACGICAKACPADALSISE